MATLKDVAKDAGVSIATVSCCLSGNKAVKPETKARIMDSIEKLKYIPNSSARNLKASFTNRIGVILTDIDNLYHLEIFKGISAYLQNRNYNISVAFSNNIPDIECEKIEDFISQNVSGLIIITCQPDNTAFFKRTIINYNIPTVFIERRPKDIDVNFVEFDNYKTVYYICNSLLNKGYRNIALITGNPHYSSEHSCIDGYKDAYCHHKLVIDNDFICITDMSKEDSFKSYMSDLSSKPLEAVITTSEVIASGVLEAFHINGIKVSEDIQLITFSEESWNYSSKLSGVIQTSRTAFTLGSSASELLIQNINSPAFFEKQILKYTDKLINSNKEMPDPPVNRITVPNIQHKNPTLNILMVDLATSHSAKLLSDYFTRQTGIIIEFEFVSQNEMLKRIIQDNSSLKNNFDIYMYDVPWLEYMVQNTLVSDITNFVEKDFNSDLLFKQNMNNCRLDNKYYGIPIIGGSQIMFYRKDLFENRNITKAFKNKYNISLRPPRTWTEFNGIAEFFTQKYNPDSPTQYGTSFAGVIDEELAPELLIRLWSYNGRIWDKYNRVCMFSQENVKAFHSIINTLNYIEKTPFETSIHQTVQEFSTGKTALLVTYSEYAAQISKCINVNIIGQVGYASLPGKTPVSVGWNFGINPFSTKRELAYKYFNWICQEDTSFYMTILDGQSPVIAPYHSHELLKLYPWLELTEKSFDYCKKRNGPYKKNSLIIPQNKIEAILCNVLRDILNDGLSIQKALESREADMKALFSSYGYPNPLHFI